MQRSVVLALASLASLALLSCGNGRSPSPVEAPASPPSALAIVRSSKHFAPHVFASSESIAAHEGMLSLAQPTAPWKVDLPARAAASLRLVRTDDATAWAEIRALDVADVAGKIDGNAIVFEKAAGGADILELVEGGSIEEVRVVHHAEAPIVSRYRIVGGPAIADVRVAGGRVEIVDHGGHVAFATAPIFAEDANGLTRALAVTIARDASGWTLSATLDPTGLATPIAIDPAWSAIAPLATPRAKQLAVTLTTGKILVLGGVTNASVRLSSTELYDPVAGTWTNVGSLPGLVGLDAMAVALPNGRALCIDDDVATAYVWNGTNTWTTAAPPPHPRDLAVLVTLADGRVLFAGGDHAGTPLATADLYDPKTNTWSATGTMKAALDGSGAVLLADGRVLVVGGEPTFEEDSSNVVEIYDPTAGTFATTAPLATARAVPLVTRLPDGRVLVTGGADFGSANGPDIKTTEIYAPSTGTFSPSGALISTFDARWITTLTSGDVLVGDNPFARWSSATGTWSFAGDLGVPRRAGVLVGIAGDRALWIGGAGGSGATLVAYANVDVYQRFANGQACDGPEACISGACVDGACCSSPSCAPGSSCATAAHAGSCAKLQGQTCAADAECGTGHCVDGVCCNVACAGQCQACDVIGSSGTCTTVAGAPHGTRTACSDGAGDVCKATTCNGTDASTCHLPAAGTVTCGASSCASGVEHHPSKCTATGTCGDTPLGCGVYSCGATACKKTCATSDDCAAGYFCPSGSTSCVPVLGLAQPCADPKACAAGLACVDGVCCASTSCPAQSTCASPGKEGRCVRSLGGACAVDDECGTGHCIDGVCCESTCDGQCEACDVVGSLGHCGPIVGAPHGGRAACATGASACASAACDGLDTTTCAGFAGSAISCRAATCSDGSQTAAAVCDGKGACPSAVTTSCGEYVCGATACLTSCKDDGDCIASASCQVGACKARTSSCSADGSSVVALDGTTTACAPFACRAGACLTSCATSNDCASGDDCSFETKSCVSPDQGAQGGTGSSGGCSTTARSSNVGTTAWVGLFCAIAFLARSARRSKRASQAVAGVAAVAASIGCSRAEPTPAPAASDAQAVLASVRNVKTVPLLAHFGTVRADELDSETVVALPGRSTLPLHVEDPHARAASVDIAFESVADVGAETFEGATVFRAIAPSTSVLYAHVPRGIEELRVLHDSAAPRAWRYRIAEGPAIAHVRIREHRIEAIDAAGVVRLSTAPIVAVDANGVGVTVDVSVEERGRVARVSVSLPSLDEAAFPVVVDPAWSAAPSMSSPHGSGAFVALPDGRILAAGGRDVDNIRSATCEIFDPKTRTWSATNPLATAREEMGAAVVGGKVLVTGGFATTAFSLSSAESYDPASGTWSAAPSLVVDRASHSMVATPGGALVFMGSYQRATTGFGSVTSAEVFDGTSWKTTATSPSEVRDEYGVAIAGTKVIVAGGIDGDISQNNVANVDIFDTTTKTWSVGPSLPTPRSAMGVIVAANGDVWFIAGGSTASTSAPSLTSVDIFTPSTSKWSVGPALLTPRRDFSAVKLAGGRYLVAGGWTTGGKVLASAEIYDPSVGGGWISAGSLTQRLSLGTPFALADGGAALVGGFDFDTTARTELYEPFANGVACSANADCASLHCVDFVCCGSASCPSGQSCSSPTKAGSCAPVNGIACTADASCGSGHCVDGVCCDTSCSAECAACDVGGHVGKCTAAKGAPHGSRAPCAAGDATCGPTCDGSDTATCHPAASGTVCGAAACSAGVVTSVSTCDGSGACIDTSQSCGAFACGTTSCKTSCATSTDCAQGFRCAASVCVPLAGKGSPCADGSACGAGLFCTDGVCCSVAACDPDATCASPTSAGDCIKERGATCAANAECGTKSCTDGHCCDLPCDGVCEACDLPGRVGTCAPVVGAPHGTRACPAGSDLCGSATCDGTAPKSCAAFASSDVSCRAAGCANGVLTSPATCDGVGHCPAATTTDCAGYACDAAGVACRTSCTTSAQCASDFECSGGKCIRLAGTCSADGTSVVASDQSTATCAPFLCRGGACLTTCTSTDDCASGATCDTASGSCTAGGGGGGGSGGGCAIAEGPSEGGPLLLLAVGSLAALGCGRRRKRAISR